MTYLQKYHTANLPELMKIISKNGIGMDSYLDNFFNSYETTTNYPPYNLIHVNNVESVLEIALAGFSKKELKVYTEYGKLIVEGKKKLRRQDPSMSIKAWLNDLSTEPGHYQKILKSGMSNLKMDYLPLSWVK